MLHDTACAAIISARMFHNWTQSQRFKTTNGTERESVRERESERASERANEREMNIVDEHNAVVCAHKSYTSGNDVPSTAVDFTAGYAESPCSLCLMD